MKNDTATPFTAPTFDHALPEKDSRGSKITYPFASMEVGASIDINPDWGKRAQAAAAQHKAKNPGWSYTMRKQENGYYRLWRIA